MIAACPPLLFRYLATAAALFASPAALALDGTLFGQAATCAQGDCDNGRGTIRTGDGTEYSGSWVNGRFVAGEAYAVRNPVAPDRVEPLVMDATGRPREGTLLRGSKATGLGLVGEYTGTFAQYSNPFIGQDVVGFARGAYIDHSGGYIYEGEFSYIPIHHSGAISGYFILTGVRIDTALNEVTRGLFVSDSVMPNMPIMFRKARADYLEKIHTEFAAQKLAAEAGAAARAAQRASAPPTAGPERKRAGLFGKLLGVVSGLASIGGVNLGPLKSSALMSLTGSITGGNSPDSSLKGILATVSQTLIKDPKLAKIIGSATDPEQMAATLAGLATGSAPITRQDYAAERAAELQGTPSGRSGSAQTMRAVMTIVRGEGSTASIAAALGGVVTDNLGGGKTAADKTAAGKAGEPVPQRTTPPVTTNAEAPAAIRPPAATAALPPAPSPATTAFGCQLLESNAALRQSIVTAAADKAQLAMFIAPEFHQLAVNAPFLGCRTVARANAPGERKGSEPMQIPGHPMNQHGFLSQSYRGTLDGSGNVLSALTVYADLVSGDIAQINYFPAEDGPDVKGVIGGTDKGYWIYLYR